MQVPKVLPCDIVGCIGNNKDAEIYLWASKDPGSRTVLHLCKNHGKMLTTPIMSRIEIVKEISIMTGNKTPLYVLPGDKIDKWFRDNRDTVSRYAVKLAK